MSDIQTGLRTFASVRRPGDDARARQVLAEVERAAAHLAAVDNAAGVDRNPKAGEVKVKRATLDGDTYSGTLSFDPASGARNEMDVTVRDGLGNVADYSYDKDVNPSWPFPGEHKQLSEKRTQVAPFEQLVQRVLVDPKTGALTYDEYTFDQHPPQPPPTPPIPIPPH